MLKLKFSDETAETNPYVDIWAGQGGNRTAAPRALSERSGGGYVLMMTISAMACSGGLLLAGIGLYEITRPLLSLSVGISLAGLGAVVVIGSATAFQVVGRKLMALRSRRRRMDHVTHP